MASTDAGTAQNLRGSLTARSSLDWAPLQFSLRASLHNNAAFQESSSRESTHQLFQRSSCKEEEEDDDDEDEEVLIQADSLGRL